MHLPCWLQHAGGHEQAQAAADCHVHMGGAAGQPRAASSCGLHAVPQDVTVTVLCYTWPMLVQAAREVRLGDPGLATGLYAAIFTLLVLASSAYSSKWPERWAPGRFDLIGNSHQVCGCSNLPAVLWSWH